MKALFWLWCAACVAGGVAMLLFMFRALDGRAAMFCVGCQESLDTAQAAFELQEKPKHYDFDAWRAAGDLNCQNAPTLRICRAHPIVVSAIDGGPTRDFMSFACSATECQWVDP